MEGKKKLGLPSVVATGVGVIVATSCLLSLGQGAGTIGTPFILSMVLACMLNCFAAFGMAELNALMPNLTGGLAQYTLACVGPFITILIMVGGYLFGNTIALVQLVPDTINFVSFRRRRRKRSKPIRQSVDW